MSNIDLNHTHNHPYCMRWSGIIMGVMVCLGLSFLLNLFAVSIGLSLFTVNDQGLGTLVLGGFIGMFIGVAVVMLVSGFVAGALGYKGIETPHLGLLYGFVTWAFALIISAVIVGQLGNYVSSYSNSLTRYSTASTVSSESNYKFKKYFSNDYSYKSRDVSPILNQKVNNVNLTGYTSLAMFILFFFGGFFAALGGYMGMTNCCNLRNKFLN